MASDPWSYDVPFDVTFPLPKNCAACAAEFGAQESRVLLVVDARERPVRNAAGEIIGYVFEDGDALVAFRVYHERCAPAVAA